MSETPTSLCQKLQAIVSDYLQSKHPDYFNKDPEYRRKKIVDFEGRVHGAGLEMFNGPMFAVPFSYYESEKNRAARAARGAVIFYIERDLSEDFFKMLGYREASVDEEDVMLEVCEKFGAELAGKLREELARQWSSGVCVSEPTGYPNTIPGGVDGNPNLPFQEELKFFMKDNPVMAVDVALS